MNNIYIYIYIYIECVLNVECKYQVNRFVEYSNLINPLITRYLIMKIDKFI